MKKYKMQGMNGIFSLLRELETKVPLVITFEWRYNFSTGYTGVVGIIGGEPAFKLEPINGAETEVTIL